MRGRRRLSADGGNMSSGLNHEHRFACFSFRMLSFDFCCCNTTPSSSVVQDGSSEYVVYHVHVRPRKQSESYVVYRRFREFKALQSALYEHSYRVKASNRPRDPQDMQSKYPLPEDNVLSMISPSDEALRNERCKKLWIW